MCRVIGLENRYDALRTLASSRYCQQIRRDWQTGKMDYSIFNEYAESLAGKPFEEFTTDEMDQLIENLQKVIDDGMSREAKRK